jgi:hypothetical protein
MAGEQNPFEDASNINRESNVHVNKPNFMEAKEQKPFNKSQEADNYR